MKSLVLALLVSSTAALAQPTPAPTFAKATTYERCSKVTMFACGMRDSKGNTYGTAKQHDHCERYTFRPNGTFTMAMGPSGTYRVTGKTVRLQPIEDGNQLGKAFELTLSDDNKKLGDLSRVP